MARGSQKFWQCHELERVEMITSLAGVLEAILQSRSIPTQESVMCCVTKNTHKIGDIIDSKDRRHTMPRKCIAT